MSTVAAWFFYCTLVGVLLGLAALAGEEAARSSGRPGRLIWFASMLASVTFPGVAYFGPETWTSSLPAFSDAPYLVLPAIVVTPSPDSAWSLERIGVRLWVLMSAVLCGYLLLSFARLRTAQRSWRRTAIQGVEVWMTPDVGPAVFGVAEASILMPAWALDLDERLRRLMLLHEEEHARAGDPQLVVAALLVLVAMPWNPALWWQLRRLRMAVEVDCDARVLRREPDRRRYGTLLLEVSRRRGGNSLVVAFAEPRAFLERRIRRIVARSTRNLRRATVLGTVALTLFVAAFYARDPVAASEVDRDARPEELPPPTTISDHPTFTPYTVKPELANAPAVADALLRSYPPLLRDAGIGGTTVLWFFLDERGRTVKASVFTSSGYDGLDQAAERVARVMSFTPARNLGRAVPVWVQIPITFAPPSSGSTPVASATRAVVPPPAQSPPPAAEPPRESGTDALRSALLPSRLELPAPSLTIPRLDLGRYVPSLEPPRIRRQRAIAEGPTFTPYTLKPELVNTQEIARALQRTYPPLLRDAGVGGTAILWFLIDERGAVQKKQIFRASGHSSLDEAALAVAERMRFRPAENHGRKVPVWVQIPVTFSSR